MLRAVVFFRNMVVYLLLGLLLSVSVAWGLALKPARLFDLWVAEAIKLDSGLERQVRVTVEHGLGTVFASYETTETPLDDRGFANHLHTYIHGVGPLKLDSWFENALSWDVTGFHGWGQRRVALRDGPDSDWSLGIDAASGFPFLALWCSWPVINTGGANERERFGEELEPDWSRPMLGGIPLTPQTEDVFSHSPEIVKRHIPRALPYLPIWPGLALNTATFAGLSFVAVRIVRGGRHLSRFRRGRCPACGHNLRGRFAAPCIACGRAPCRGPRGRAVAP